jgi:uncharacterized protein YgbK (DUF1537 family)
MLTRLAPPGRWLILADDLTGAADCAIAFARRGLSASVVWGGDLPDDAVLALDADSRRLGPIAAAACHRSLLHAHHREGAALFKKIDSTLRGQPAAELAATVHELRARGRGALAIVAPAFPGTGRTTVDGRIRIGGQPLEQSPLWARDHSYPSADLVAVLRLAGLRVRLAGLDAVRAGLAEVVDNALAAGEDVVVCDAVTPADLRRVAEATLPRAADLFWTGSGGLAQALACGVAGPARQPPVEVAGGILFVVGSVAEASRAAAALLAADGAVHVERIPPAVLHDGPGAPAWQGAARRITQALATGTDVLVEIAAAPDADLRLGAALTRRLAALLRPAAPGLGALFATGGETALALLDALGITGIQMIDEVEPGVPLGLTRGALAIPVVTKAGAFGDAGTLARCLSHLRRHRRPESLP